MIDRIYAKNFRRIQECDLILRDGVTALTGKNGTGKSTIIESMMFNLYGKAKSGTKKDSIRRRNADENDPTFTSVDFTVSGIHYRCRRWCTKKMSTMASLYSYNDDEYEKVRKADPTKLDKKIGQEIASSASGVTAAINDIMGVSYDGFKASFVAQQKELDSLASLTPDKRKQFFLDLLGYSKLDKIKPELSSELRGIDKVIKVLEKQSISVNDSKKKIAEYEKQIADRTKRIDKGRRMLGKLENELTKTTDEYENGNVIAEKVRTYENDVKTLEAELNRITNETKKLNESINEDKKTSTGYDASSSLSEKISEARDKATKAREHARISDELDANEMNLSEKKTRYAKLKSSHDDLIQKTNDRPDMETPASELAKMKESKAALLQNKKTVSSSLSSLISLSTSVANGDIAKCPTCGSEISDTNGRKHLDNEKKELENDLEKIDENIASMEKKIKQKESELETEKMKSRKYDADKRELDRTDNEMKILSEDISSLEKTVSQKRLEHDRTSTNAMSKRELMELDTEIADMRIKLKHENEMKEAFYRAQRNIARLETITSRENEAKDEATRKKDYIKKNKKTADKVTMLKEKKNEQESNREFYIEFLQKYEKEKASFEALLSAERGNMSLAEKQKEELSERRTEYEIVKGAQFVVEKLRRDLPAKIAPSLSETASHLMDIATNGRYTMLEIDDSYEVQVYTDDSISPMSQMSGGETDIVSLCVRIAISKMLLEASGDSSQTMVLDEIFGALDDERRESACNALKNIGSEIPRILCITHIDEIKDMADWTYIVETDENGVSHVREQDSISI